MAASDDVAVPDHAVDMLRLSGQMVAPIEMHPKATICLSWMSWFRLITKGVDMAVPFWCTLRS